MDETERREQAGDAGSLTDLLQSRRSAKVLGDPKAPLRGPGLPRATVDRLVAAAGRAPFHYEAQARHRATLSSPVPWRMHKLDRQGCLALLAHLQANDLPAGKVANFLAAAAAFIQVTWLPDERPSDGVGLFHGDQRNMEHIAAAGAAVQNLLLLATEAGFRSYWSSGDAWLRGGAFSLLGIGENEILLGAVFLFPADVGDSEILPGKLREARGDLNDWSRWVAV